MREQISGRRHQAFMPRALFVDDDLAKTGHSPQDGQAKACAGLWKTENIEVARALF